MITHLTAEQMQNYLVRRLSIEDLGTIGEHLHGCRSCYQSYLSVLQTRFPIEIDFDELGGLKDWHLEGEELTDYLAGRMDQVDLDYAKLHLQECGSCEQRVNDSAKNWPDHAPSTKSTHNESRAPWREYLPAFHSAKVSSWQVAAALLLVVGLTLVLWAVLRAGPDRPEVAKDLPSETVPSEKIPERVTAPPPTPGKIDTGRSGDSSVQRQTGVARNRDNDESGRRTDWDESALIAKNLTMPPAIEMLDRTPSMAVRGNQASIQSFKIVGPFATAITDDRPTFSWTGLGGATSYVVSVFDADLHLIETSGPLSDTQWKMPHRLDAGIVYTWTVTALKDGQEVIAPASPTRAEFKVLGKLEMHNLTLAVSRMRSHAARGVLYAEVGLLDEAEREFRAHLRLRPGDERVQELLQIVLSWRAVGPQSAALDVHTKKLTSLSFFSPA